MYNVMGVQAQNAISDAENLKGIVDRLSNTTETQRIGCRKCGFPGHLAFECYNTFSTSATQADKSSTSTESDSDSELRQLEQLLEQKKKKEEEIKRKLKEKKKKKKE